MQIQVNKDNDEYKDDFFKGLTLRQTIVCAVTVAVSVCSFLLFSVVLRLPQTISLYLVFPVALPVAAAGLWKDHQHRQINIKKKNIKNYCRNCNHLIADDDNL